MTKREELFKLYMKDPETSEDKQDMRFSDWLVLRITALEALAADPHVITAAEWAGLSVDTRAALNVMGHDLETISRLALTEPCDCVPGVVEEIERIARKYAPQQKPETVETAEIVLVGLPHGLLLEDTGADPVHPHFELKAHIGPVEGGG